MADQEKKDVTLAQIKAQLLMFKKHQSDLSCSKTKLSRIASEEGWLVNFHRQTITDGVGKEILKF